MVYHVLNRSAGRFRMFRAQRDFESISAGDARSRQIDLF
jgi:hypothetical protein